MKKFIYTSFIMLMAICSQAQLKITEIMYNPPEAGDDTLEYLEIVNLSRTDYSLEGHTFSSGIVDTFGPGDIVPAGGYFVTAKKSSAMQAVFGINPHQWKSGSLNNSGEILTLSDKNGNVVFSLDFGDSGKGWVPEADGDGYSMELCNLDADPAFKDNWSKSATGTGKIINDKEVFGTPGAANTATCSPVYADTVYVTDHKFTPATITIKEGETVLWIFSQGIHNVNGSQATFPSNPDDFRSGDPAPAPFTFAHTFTNPGSNDYQCDPHVAQGMVGKVIVEPLNPPKVYPVRSIEEAGEIDQEGVAILKDSLAEVTGVVYGVNMRNSGIQATLIDSDNIGIGIFNANQNFGYTVTEGDMLTVKGTITQFNGLQQIVIDTLIRLSSNNPLVTPEVVGTLNEDTESSLITLENVTLKDPSEWNQGNTFNVVVTDGTNDYTVRVVNTTTLSGEPAPTEPFNITGIGGQFDNSAPYFDGYQLLPRYKEDLKLRSANKNALASAIVIYPNPVAAHLYIATDLEVRSITILNMNGVELKCATSARSIDTGGLLPGMYLLKFETDKGKAYKTFIKAQL